MKFFRYLFSLIIPQVIFKTSSPISGEITVVQHFGQRSLTVGGLVQSVSPSADGEGSYSFPRYSVIIVDLYLGTTFPPAVQSREFLQGLLNLVADEGLVVFNRTEKAGAFLALLRDYFAEITAVEVFAPGGGMNYLYLGRKK